MIDLTAQDLTLLREVRDEIAGLEDPGEFAMQAWTQYSATGELRPSGIVARLIVRAGTVPLSQFARTPTRFSPLSSATATILLAAPANWERGYGEAWFDALGSAAKRDVAVKLLDAVLERGGIWW